MHDAAPGSLAAVVAATPAPRGTDPAGQIPHWLFAFDAAGMVTFRTLALLATHPEQRDTARVELDGSTSTGPRNCPTCALEAVRLWPTTPALLRESTRTTPWGPRGTTSVIFTPFFHRDADTLPYADAFRPEIWLDGTTAANPALVPFSGGPAQCPGRNIVLLTVSTMLAALLAGHDLVLTGKPRITAGKALPATLDNFSLRFAATSR